MRTLRRVSVLALVPLLLGGCATRGILAVDCPQFPRFVHDLPYSDLEQQIRDSRPEGGLEGVPDDGLEADEALGFDRAIDAAIASQRRRLSEESPDPRNSPDNPVTHPSVLLLSGGGQWGAFGAGLLTTLAQDRSTEMPNPIAITGVSTGSLQMLFVGAGLENEAVRQALRAAYTPAKESDVVDRQAKVLAVVTGAMAGLKPLRARVENALCSDAAIARAGKGGIIADCPMLDRLAKTDTLMFSGFVEAASGRFQYADVNAIARAQDLSAAQRRSCIAGAALASVAMPVFFQQVSVAGKTYYDGGVRQSVFATHIQRRADNRIVARNLRRPPTPILVLRNGPTDVQADAGADARSNAIDAALRAEAIIVNQVEVSSVAALRLQDPAGYLGFASADGWRGQPYTPAGGTPSTCEALKQAEKDAQFAPDFMKCIMAYGDRRARADRVWLPLLTVGPPAQPLPQVPPASNDDEGK